MTGKDVILTLCGLFNQDEVLNHGVEFSGEGVRDLSVDDRLTIANMTTEWGALTALFPVDDVTLHWLRRRATYVASSAYRAPPGRSDNNSAAAGAATLHPRLTPAAVEQVALDRMEADANAHYAKTLSLDLASVRPHVAGPNHVKLMHTTHELERQRVLIQKAYLLSCVNGRADDLAQAAQVIKGKRVAPHVHFFVAAASAEVQRHAEERGDWQTLLAAGAQPLPPGCGPCVGMYACARARRGWWAGWHVLRNSCARTTGWSRKRGCRPPPGLGLGVLEDGEVGISATNRNFVGRMGSRKAQAYLASPAVVAASAVAGHICGPYEHVATRPVGSVAYAPPPERGPLTVPLLPGFPSTLAGEVRPTRAFVRSASPVARPGSPWGIRGWGVHVPDPRGRPACVSANGQRRH